MAPKKKIDEVRDARERGVIVLKPHPLQKHVFPSVELPSGVDQCYGHTYYKYLPGGRLGPQLTKETFPYINELEQWPRFPAENGVEAYLDTSIPVLVPMPSDPEAPSSGEWHVSEI